MNGISDAVVIGIVLGLVFGAVSYYLYSRMGQLERKVGLMENILLDLKVTTEQAIQSSSEPLEDSRNDIYTGASFVTTAATVPMTSSDEPAHVHTEAEEQQQPQETRELFVEQPRVRTPPSSAVQVDRDEAVAPQQVQSQPQQPSDDSASRTTVGLNYEAMTYKELTSIARQRGMTGIRNHTKQQLIDALRGVTSKKESEPYGLSNWTSGVVSFGNTDQSGVTLDTLGSAEDASAALAPLTEAPEMSLVSDE